MKQMSKMAAGVLLLSQALSGAALAASVTLTGDTVDFTFDDALMGAFGTPTLSGDTLSFMPAAFGAESLNGAGIALSTNTVNIRVSAHSGYAFAAIDTLARGDYMLLGSGSAAAVAGQVRVFDAADPLAELSRPVAPSAPLALSGYSTHDWTATTATDLSGWSDAAAINVTWQNLLIADTSGTGSSLAFVDAKYGGLTALTLASGGPPASPVPEAQVSALMLAGLGLIGWQAARRRAARAGG